MMLSPVNVSPLRLIAGLGQGCPEIVADAYVRAGTLSQTNYAKGSLPIKTSKFDNNIQTRIPYFKFAIPCLDEDIVFVKTKLRLYVAKYAKNPARDDRFLLMGVHPSLNT
jgi:hypothetical protein